MWSHNLSGQPTAAGLESKRYGITTHFVITKRRCLTQISMDGIIKQISLAFGGLQDCIAPLSDIETPVDDFHNLDETADFFSVWLRNVAAIREECETLEHCLNDNYELKDTLVELLVDVQNDLAEGACGAYSRARIAVISDQAQTAQDTAQCNLDSRSLDDAKATKLAAMRDSPDDTPILSLASILQDVYNTTICLMRLSKPLLDSHRHHQTTTRRCDEDDKHHVSHLQRWLPRATLTIMKRLSKSICARRFEITRINSHWKGHDSALGDDAFLRVVLLELASVSDDTIKYDSSTGSSLEQDTGYLAEEPSSFEDAENMESYREERSEPSPAKVDSLFPSPEYTLKNPEPTMIRIAQHREGVVYKTKSNTGQHAKETSFVDHGSSDDGSEAATISACTRCRVVRSRGYRDYHMLTSSSARRGATLVYLSVGLAQGQDQPASTTMDKKAEY